MTLNLINSNDDDEFDDADIQEKTTEHVETCEEDKYDEDGLLWNVWTEEQDDAVEDEAYEWHRDHGMEDKYMARLYHRDLDAYIRRLRDY